MGLRFPCWSDILSFRLADIGDRRFQCRLVHFLERRAPRIDLEELDDETQKMHEEYGRADPVYAEIFREMSAFKQDAYQRLQLSEYTFDSYQIRRLRR